MSGIFYINDNDHDEKLEDRKKEDEAKEIAQETLELVAAADDNMFPEFMWAPQINDFEEDDAYRTKAACKNPAVLRAYSIGKKYQNYWDYVEAMEAYVEYAKYIEAVYGDFNMMARASKEGYGTVYIPALPKLTHKKKNRLIIESGFMPSKIDADFVPPEGTVEESIGLLSQAELEIDEERPLPKRIQRIQEAMVETKQRTDRVNGIYAYSSGGQYRQGMDAIVNFLTSSNSDSIQIRGQTESSIAQLMEDLHMYDYIPEEIADWMALPPNISSIVGGIHQNQEQVNYKEIIKTLEKNGFDFLFSSAVEGMDKEAVRALHREFKDIDLERLPKKERKKVKKMLKKQQEDRRNIMVGDRRLQRSMLQNRIHLTRDTDFGGINPDFINFHLSDALPYGDDE